MGRFNSVLRLFLTVTKSCFISAQDESWNLLRWLRILFLMIVVLFRHSLGDDFYLQTFCTEIGLVNNNYVNTGVYYNLTFSQSGLSVY